MIATPSPPSGGGSSNTALGLAALIGAAGVALLRARQLTAAAGLGDAVTLTALGHTASTFWAGSCSSLGTGGGGNAATINRSLTADAVSPADAHGGRSRFGVEGVTSGAIDAVSGGVEHVASVAPKAAGDDSTGLVAILFLASAIVGGMLGALVPRRAEA